MPASKKVRKQSDSSFLLFIAIISFLIFIIAVSFVGFSNNVYNQSFPKRNLRATTTYSGDNYGVNYFGFSQDDSVRAKQLDLIKQVGAKWVRGVTCQWQSIQWDQNMYANNLWNFAACDKIVDEIVSRGLTPVMALWYSS